MMARASAVTLVVLLVATGAYTADIGYLARPGAPAKDLS
jgi:hypothetical protein